MPDGTTFRIPEAWRPEVVVRRGGRLAPAAGPDETAAEHFDKELTELKATRLEEVIGHPGSDRELVAAVRADLAGEPTPLGTAAATRVRISRLHWSESVPERAPELVDVWVARHGLLFAVQVVVDLGRLHLDDSESGPALRWWQPGDYVRDPEPIARRMRELLAAADEADYQAAVDVLARCRDGLWPRLIAAYLVPDQTAWVDELCAEAVAQREEGWDGDWPMLFHSIGTLPQLDMVAAADPPYILTYFLTTLCDVFGPDIVPFLGRLIDESHPGYRDRILEVVKAIPTDEAFDLMLARITKRPVLAALLECMERDPVRAARLLTQAAASGRISADLLVRHLQARPEVPAELSEDVRDAAKAIVARHEGLRETLPDLLVRPPWTRPRSGKRPAVVAIDDSAVSAPPRIVWQEGEQERWARAGDSRGYWAYFRDWSEPLEKFAAGTLWYEGIGEVLANGPEELVRPLLAEARPKDTFLAGMWGKQGVARFGLDALPFAFYLASTQAANGPLLLPFVDAEIANLMADRFARLKNARSHATAWLLRHAADAVPLLLPTALGKPGPARQSAEAALRFLAANGQDVSAVAAGHGAEAQNAIDAMLAVDPAEILPAKIPTAGDWLTEAAPPGLLLRDRVTRLPDWAVEHVITMLMISRLDSTYVGLETVTEICDPRSTAEFGRQLFETWCEADTPPKDGWVLTALAWSGDDETVRRLAPKIEAWPADGGHARSVTGLDVLAGIGSNVALSRLHAISQKAKFKGLRAKAQEKMAELARDRGLSPEQLADRIVPDFGLDARAPLVLDYGPRRFEVGFDEQLKPFVTDDKGKRRTAVPKPGAKDDPELASDSYERYSGLKKGLRTVAADQIWRLEQAMATQRRWSVEEFTELFVEHPLVSKLVRRLVWVIDDGSGGYTGFRLAEDRTFADVGDDALSLPSDASIGIGHPLHLGEQLPAWADLFADYEILQPFPQLGRQVFTADETGLDRFHDVPVPTGKLLGMQRRGWQRGEPQDAGWQYWLIKALPGVGAAVLHFSPGVLVGVPDVEPEQRVTGVNLTTGAAYGTAVALSSLDAVTVSELFADLVSLTSDQ